MVNFNGVGNPEFSKDAQEEIVEQNCATFSRWNYKEMMLEPLMIIYWLKCIFGPACYIFKNNILYLWSLWKELMETLYEGKDIGL